MRLVRHSTFLLHLDIAMNTKLTLRMDENLIAQAKAYAAKEGRSLSDLVGTYFARISEPKAEVNALVQSRTGSYPMTDALKGVLAPTPSPRRSSFYGVLKDNKLDESDYRDYLVKKHL